MQILQTVVVKQILTEKSKDKLYETFQSRRSQLNKEIDQLRFELKRLEKTKSFSPTMLKRQFEKEINSRREKIKLIEFQLEQLHILPLGSELKEKEVQALIEVKVGDPWTDSTGESIIVIKDGIIEEIR